MFPSLETVLSCQLQMCCCVCFYLQHSQCIPGALHVFSPYTHRALVKTISVEVCPTVTCKTLHWLLAPAVHCVKWNNSNVARLTQCVVMLSLKHLSKNLIHWQNTVLNRFRIGEDLSNKTGKKKKKNQKTSKFSVSTIRTSTQ